MMGGVYAIINIKNDFIYIGSFTNQGFIKRINMHKSHLNNNKHHSWILQRDWNKFSKDNFIFQLLEFCSINKVRKLEQKYLDMNKIGIKNKSYNILNRVDRKFLPKEVIDKIKKAHRNPNLLINTNTSGYKGVCPYKNKWKASIFRYGKSYHIGYYKTKKQASRAYNKINILSDKEFFKWWNKEYNENRKDFKYRLYGENCPWSKLTKKDINRIRKMYKTGKYFCTELANKFQVDQSHISNIVNNKIRKAG